LKIPEHGKVIDDGDGDYSYFPEKGFIGNDRATLLVEMGGKKIRMEYFFRVMTSVHEGEGVDPWADNCPKKIRVWKISSLNDVYGNDFIAATDIEAPQAFSVGTVANDPAGFCPGLRLPSCRARWPICPGNWNLTPIHPADRFACVLPGAAGRGANRTSTSIRSFRYVRGPSSR
jgi:hypothetical protein